MSPLPDPAGAETPIEPTPLRSRLAFYLAPKTLDSRRRICYLVYINQRLNPEKWDRASIFGY